MEPFGFSMALPPTSSTTTDDGAVYMKKRRRPALACDQCRRRKVKCDRTSPCGPCQRSRIDTCTYRPEWMRTVQVSTEHANHANHASHTNNANANNACGRGQTHHGHGHGLSRDSDIGIGIGISDWQGQLSAMGTGKSSVSLPQLHERRCSSLPSDASSVDLSLPSEGRMQLDRNSTAETSEPPDRPTAPMRGTYVKSRFYGPSHWINASEEFQHVLAVQREAETNELSELHQRLRECKRLCRICKAHPYHASPRPVASLASSLPPMRLCDELVHLYLRTFETVYRILHVPTFRAQYAAFQAEPLEAANPAFVAQLLLICALGTCFYAKSDMPRYNLRAMALRWMADTQAWMGSPSEKSRLNLTGLQTQCLLLLAKQAFPGGPEMVWISAGSLVRAAMQLGLHHSPSKLPGVGTFEGEMRKRIWATILDLQIQSSIESGGPPLISENDYDCEPPSNVDDSQIDHSTTTPIDLLAKPPTTFTSTSLQCALARTLPVRLEVTKYLNDFSSHQTYDETLRLGNKLKALLDEHTRLFRSFGGQHQQPTAFQIKLFELLTYRFLLVLHFPFAIRAKKNPRYYFSHKVCLDLSLSLLRYNNNASSPGSTTASKAAELADDDDYSRLQVLGSGLFRDAPLRSVIFVCIELLLQLEDDSGQLGSTFNSLGRQELYKTVAEYVQLLAKRIEAGETTVRGHVFFSSLLAHMDALQASRPSKDDILAAMEKSLEFCQSMLKTMAQAYSATNLNTNSTGSIGSSGGGGSGSGSDGVPVSASDEFRYSAPGSGATTCTTESGLLENSLWFDLEAGSYFDMDEHFLPF